MRPLPISNKWIFYPLIILVALSLATPALADYLGPNRTVTETIGGVCKVVLNECQYVPAKNDYRYKNVGDWSCANESKPWQAYPSDAPRACSKNSVGDQYWSREEATQTVITTHPAATITGSLQNCTLQNGWCGGAVPQLTLNANEPLTGYSILLIEGLLNGDTFACPTGAASCSVPLAQGDNNFAYWALSSWGDSSTMGTWTARVDTVPPDVSLDISGANGANGWFVSPVSITATGSDTTSGLASALLSVDSGAWQSSATLNEGTYEIDVTASDYAGNTSSASTIFAVDTTTPAINVAVNGKPGRNGWYRSNIEVSAIAQDATSGIAAFEVSIDGAAFQAYSSSVSFSDGPHTIQYRAMDTAGHQTEIPVQKFYVDTIAPDIELPGTWQLRKNVPYAVSDTGSGLATLRIVIEDEDERYAKVAWDENVSGALYSQDINWNGQFKDKTDAAPGTYLVWIKAADAAGNERIKLGKVIVPEPNVILGLFQPEEIPADTPVPPEDLYPAELSEEWVSPPVSDFGNATTVQTEITTQSYLLATGTAGSIPYPASNVLWGAAAAAAIGAATSLALDERRRREEALARQAAEAAEQRERDEKKRADKLQKQQENWLAAQALEHDQQPTRTHSPTDGKVGRQEWDESLAWMREQAEIKQRAFPGPSLSVSREIKAERLEVEQGMDWIIKNAEIEHYIHEQNTEDMGMRLQAYRDAISAGPKKAPDPESNYWEKFKHDVNGNIIQPLKTKVYEPFIRPLVEINNEIAERQQLWWDRNVYWRHIYPATQDWKQTKDDWSKKWDENFYQPHIKPWGEKIAEDFKDAASRFNDEVYQPTIKPFIEQEIQKISRDLEQLDKYVYQPLIAPLVKAFDEKMYQPHIKPFADQQIANVNELNDWINENIYDPFLAPIDRDIEKYIVQPAVRKAEDWWGEYGEWVHGALDVVGFVPVLGEIADFINGLIYLAEGRRLEATLSAVSAVPLLGYLGAPGKFALKLGQETVDIAVGATYKAIGGDLAKKAAVNLAQEGVEHAASNVGKTFLKDIWAQRVLDAVGCIPGVGNATTMTNALLQLGKQQYVDATMSLVSMVPVVGGFASTIRKVVDDSLGRLLMKEMTQQAIAKSVKELAEGGALIITKEVKEEIVEGVVKEAGEEAVEKIAKEVVVEGTEQVSKEAGEILVSKAAKETLKEIPGSALKNVKKELNENASETFIESIREEGDHKSKDNESPHDRVLKKIIEETPNEQGTDRFITIDESTLRVKTKYEELVKRHGERAVEVMSALPPEHSNKLLRTLDDEVLDSVVQKKPDEIAALCGWSDKDLQEQGASLALRAQRDAEVLATVDELIASGPINPEKLNDKQKALIEKIAELSTQNGDQNRVVLGKWLNISSGFVQRAQETNSVHYNPHPAMWNKLAGLGAENQGQVAWLINQQVIQTGMGRGLPFEYTLSGIPVKDIPNESRGLDKVFAGATDEAVMQALKLDYLPIRMKELQELQKAGYNYTFDDISNSFIFSPPQKGSI